MSNLISCRACEKIVSSGALSCPHCGDPNPAGDKPKCSRCGQYVDSVSTYNGSSIGIGTFTNVCDKCWNELADKDEQMVG